MRFRPLHLIPILLFLLLHSLLHAQSFGVLAGRVTDQKGNPIDGAVVEVLKTKPRLGSYARNDGSYRVLHLAPGAYKIVAQVPPYRMRDTFNVKIAAGATDTFNIRLDARKMALAGNGNTGMDGRVVERMGAMARTPVREEAALDVASDDALEPSSAPAPPPPAPTEASGRRESAGGHGVGTSGASKMIASRGGRAEGVGEGPSFAYHESRPKGSLLAAGVSDKVAAPSTTSEGAATDAPAAQQLRQDPGQLTAGEWSDLDNWPFWLDVVADSNWSRMLTYWGFNPASRVTVRLVDGARAVIDAEVRLVDGQGLVLWNARTDNRGRAELFAGVNGRKGEYRVEVKNHGTFMSAGMVTSGSAPLVVQLPGGAARRDEFDLMFLLDATGSMGDEMSYIKAELEDVINRNREAANEDLRLRLSCNFYRDEGDEYLVRPFDFSESTFDMIGNLRDQEADGGGDTPEAMEVGLEDAIEKHDWSPNARARLMFLVLDAPPHYTPDRLEKLQQLAQRAAAKGIRIIPIASSGVDKETEFLLRLLGIYTGGTYTFLTDDSGIGGSHIKPTVGAYKVEYLNNLMVRVIARYLAVDDLTADEGGTGMELH
jgi:hypothetical protein